MNLLYLTILFPLISYLLLIFFGGRCSKNHITLIGVGSVSFAALITLFTSFNFFKQGVTIFTQTLWTWIHIGHFDIKFNLILDNLSVAMLIVVTCIGSLIHIFASWYMRENDDFSRFFAYTNLFIASMSILVLADNLMFMYLGWELVGLCSYLLIGFYHRKSQSGKSAIKAFITTRIGDVFLALAIFILYNELGTLNFNEINRILPLYYHNHVLDWIAFMLLCGAVGKSAQLPLQTWLADAMVGPTPVSALIHAATMITGGIYLIVRTHNIFLLTPQVLHLVSLVGASTIVLASLSALVQRDIKRILAYSTMSQVGYMFLAIGVQAWNAAMFHLITHACFKALLFLSAGSIILSCNHEQNIFNMGGLRKSLPFIYFCFLVGGSSLAALPLVTAGFYSKEDIIFMTFSMGHINLAIIALFGSLITSIYTFRMIFLIFHGESKIKVIKKDKGIAYYFPLIILLLLSTVCGSLVIKHLCNILPEHVFETKSKIILEMLSGILVISGIIIAHIFWFSKPPITVLIKKNKVSNFFSALWFDGWRFDTAYDKVFVKPYIKIARILKNDPLNSLMNIPLFISRFGNKILVASENGNIRWYIASMSIGALFVIILMLKKNL